LHDSFFLKKVADGVAVALHGRQMVADRFASDAMMVATIERRGQADMAGTGPFPESGFSAPIGFGALAA
jgi:hypothetical protein